MWFRYTLADRQTHMHTDTLITALRSPIQSRVIKARKRWNRQTTDRCLTVFAVDVANVLNQKVTK